VSDLLGAFLLGNASILTNVCLLPLYPGLLAFLAGTAGAERARRLAPLFGLVVLAGVLATMLLLGGVLFAAGRGFELLLPWLLPAAYVAVILLGAAMLLGRNPFAGLATAQVPLVRHPVGGAFVYGLLLAPLTLPCTGPIVVSAFILGTGSGASLGGSLLWFVAFGLGFGWPLVALPLAAAPAQRRFTRWMVSNHGTITRASGLLLVAVGLWGLWVEVLPNVGLTG